MVAELTAREFAGFQRLVAASSGITLGESKRQLLAGRVVRHLRERGLPSFGAYLDVIRADASGSELICLLDLVSTNETRFFRERGHFEYLERTLFEAWRTELAAGLRPPRLRIWSAACSTGQEPYSVAMRLLADERLSAGFSIEVLGSDLSTRALRTAELGEYDVARRAQIPEPLLRRFMLRGVASRAGRMRVSDELRRVVRFRRVNLVDTLDHAEGTFDVIFCCNALIYFSREGRADVVRRLVAKLAPGGRLFVGHAESLHEHRDLLRPVAPTVYAQLTDPHHRERTQ